MGTTMLAATYKRNGIKLVEMFGTKYPEYFVHPVAEYRALTAHAAVIDLTHWQTFRLSGKDRVSFLNAMLTNDIASLQPNHGCHCLATTIKGKIIADLFVFVLEQDIRVFVHQGDGAAAYDVLQKHIIMEDVRIEDESSKYGVLALEGPKAEEVLWRMFSTGPFPKEPRQCVSRAFEDVDVFVMRNSVSGEGGYHMMFPAADIERLRNYLVQAARGSDGLAVGGAAWNMRRIEQGLAWFDVDFSADSFPDEARLGSAVSYTKGCFLGQEPLARLHYRGHVNRALVGLTTDDDAEETQKLAKQFEVATNNYDENGLHETAEASARALDLRSRFAPGTELFRAGDPAGKAVGRVTSAVFSPRLGKPLLLGYVRREALETREALTTERSQNISVIDLPVAP